MLTERLGDCTLRGGQETRGPHFSLRGTDFRCGDVVLLLSDSLPGFVDGGGELLGYEAVGAVSPSTAARTRPALGRNQNGHSTGIRSTDSSQVPRLIGKPTFM